MKAESPEEPESVSNHPCIIYLNIAVNLTYVWFFQQMPHKETNNMTPPRAAETRGLQELDVSERKEKQEPTKSQEVNPWTAT